MTELSEIHLTDITFGGDALGRIEGEVVFVPFGLPGERAQVELIRRKADYAFGRMVDVLDPSPHRVAAPCPYFGLCGGCQWQHAEYEQQLAMKSQVVADQLRRIGGFLDASELVRETIGMVNPWNYRNHVRFSLGRKYGDAGFTYRGSRRLLPIDACTIAHPRINEVLTTVQRRCIGLRAHQIMVRYGSNTGDLLISPALPAVPELTTGQTFLTDEILGRRFHISVGAFFQVNTRRESRQLPSVIEASWIKERYGEYSMADLLALLVLDRVAPDPDATVLDAYCGVGTFSTLLAPRVRRVIGVEESSAAVKDAVGNSSDLDNVELVTGKSEAVVAELTQAIDAAVVDPSRIGCAPALLAALLERHPRRLVYVSCDPATLARDLRILNDGGYAIESIQPVDMFPQTYHVETVTTLIWSR